MSTDDTPPRVWWDATRGSLVVADEGMPGREGRDVVIEHWRVSDGEPTTQGAALVELRPASAEPMFTAAVVRQWEDMAVERGYDLDAAHGRIDVLSRLLRGVARRLGALRRDYNAENRKLREDLAASERINTMPADEQVVERVARKLHETSEMRLFTWDRANASRRHGHWHDVMRERARAVLAAASPAPVVAPADHRADRGDQVAAWIKRRRDEWGGPGFGEWESLNCLLDDYRLHADTGTPLNEDADEGGHTALSGEAQTDA